jgi:hypothetical protein
MAIQRFYHGSGAEKFSEFRPGDRLDSTGLIWLAKNRYYASEYGITYIVYADIGRCFDTRSDAEAKRIYDEYIQGAENADYGISCGGAGSPEGYANDGLPYWENNDAVWELAKAHGYDSIATSEGRGREGIGVRPNTISKFHIRKS